MSLFDLLAGAALDAAEARERPVRAAYPHVAVFAGMTYTWMFPSRTASGELSGRDNAWLRSACRERGIAASKLNRSQLKDALTSWQAQRETALGWEHPATVTE